MSDFSSVQFIHSVVSDSLRPHELQHTRPPCPSPTPRVHSDSRPSSQWCHPAISSSVVPFSSCPQSLPSIRVFSNESTLRMRWPKYWSSALASFLPKKSQGWSPSEWTGWISLQSKELRCHQIFSKQCLQAASNFNLTFHKTNNWLQATSVPQSAGSRLGWFHAYCSKKMRFILPILKFLIMNSLRKMQI